jgi:hypothetical protein
MMKVPFLNAAVVPDRKLTGYLLAATHPDGAAKANFLLRFGFGLDAPDVLRQALLDHVRVNDVAAARPNAYGVLYEVFGPLTSPDGRNPLLKTIWMIDDGASIPRFITVVPIKGTLP